MKTAQRKYRLDSIKMDAAYYTEEGYLVDHPIVTRCGIFEYATPEGGMRRELRLPEEVFAEKSLASYEGKPIIITHEAGEVTKDNVHKEQIGTILGVGYRDGNNVRCKIVIHNTDALKKCGLKELSLGYGLNLDETPGKYAGELYDAIQRNIEVNHLALVGEARAGDSARLNIDHKDTNKEYLKGGPIMKTVTKSKKKATAAKRHDGDLTPEELEQAIALFKAQQGMDTAVADAEEEDETQNMDAEEVINSIKERKDRRDSEAEQMDAEEVVAEQEADIESLLNVIDELQAANDMSAADEDDLTEDGEDTKKTTTDEDDLTEDEEDTEPEEEGKSTNADSIDKMVGKQLRAYLDVCRVADRLNLDGVENMKLLDARKKVIKAVNPKLRLDGKSANYINAAYDIAKQNSEGRKGVNNQRKSMMQRADNAEYLASATKSGASDARDRMMEKRGKRGTK